MESKVERLMRGDHAERVMLLMDADTELMKDIIHKVESINKKRYTHDELQDLNVINFGYDDAIRDLKSKNVAFKEKVKILRRDGADFIHKILKPMKRQKRKRKNCPIPKCRSVGLLQLHNHLKHVHKLNDEDRKYWLSVARLDKLGIPQDSIILKQDVRVDDEGFITGKEACENTYIKDNHTCEAQYQTEECENTTNEEWENTTNEEEYRNEEYRTNTTSEESKESEKGCMSNSELQTNKNATPIPTLVQSS